MIVILTSCRGLGVYKPAVNLAISFQKKKIACTIIFIEELYKEANVNLLEKSSSLMHKSNSFANAAFKFNLSGVNPYDEHKVKNLIDDWKHNKNCFFVVFSGFWLAILEQYRKSTESVIYVNCCHLDVTYTPSWAGLSFNGKICHDFFFDIKNKKVAFSISSPINPDIEKKPKHNDIVLHGGGWALGSYLEKIEQLISKGYTLHVSIVSIEDIRIRDKSIRYYLLDKDFNKWIINGKNLSMPDHYYVNQNNGNCIYEKCSNNIFVKLISESKFIISKPGGMTLLDSINLGTPLLFLETYTHETPNGEFGAMMNISYPFEKWYNQGCPQTMTDQLTESISNVKKNTIEYSEYYIDKFKLI